MYTENGVETNCVECGISMTFVDGEQYRNTCESVPLDMGSKGGGDLCPDCAVSYQEDSELIETEVSGQKAEAEHENYDRELERHEYQTQDH